MKAGDFVQSRSIMGYPVGRVLSDPVGTPNGETVVDVEWEPGVQTICGNQAGRYVVESLSPVEFPDFRSVADVERWLS